MEECHWCDKPTGNPIQRVLNGNLEYELIAFCDSCQRRFDYEPVEIKW